MILNKMILCNFRQFYGIQEIVFAKGKKNITVIFGENGTGKTGIFRALMFSLFGEVKIDQDGKDSDLRIVNLKAVDENTLKATNAYVTIDFINDGKNYILTRKYKASKIGNTYTEIPDGLELRYTDKNGNWYPESIEDVDIVKDIISELVDKNTKDFFFFDGEKIDNLAKTDKSVKKEVKDGIIKLLQIDQVDKAIRILKSLSTSEKSRITSLAESLEITRIERKEEDLKMTIEELENDLDDYITEKQILSEEISEINKRLNKSQEIKKLVDKKNEVENKLYLQREIVKLNSEKINEFLVSLGASIILKDYFKEVDNYLNNFAFEQDNLISLTAIQKSLKSGMCALCGSNLNDHDKLKHNVNILLENYKSDNSTFMVNYIKEANDKFRNTINQYDGKIEKKLLDYNDKKSNLDEIVKRKEYFEKEIVNQAISEKNFKHIQINKNKKSEELNVIEEKISKTAYSIEEKNKELERLNREYTELIEKNDKLKFDAKILLFINELINDFSRIFKIYSDNMRYELSEETTNIFRHLISRKDKSLINRIIINEKYEIEVYNWGDLNITSDISQGQRQILSISFITALSKIASKNFNNKSFPLFMDTPLGRISGENRDNLILNIPSFTSQWILLLTDTELSTKEEETIKSTDKLGKFFFLNQKDNGHSIIEEKSIYEKLSTR